MSSNSCFAFEITKKVLLLGLLEVSEEEEGRLLSYLVSMQTKEDRLGLAAIPSPVAPHYIAALDLLFIPSSSALQFP